MHPNKTLSLLALATPLQTACLGFVATFASDSRAQVSIEFPADAVPITADSLKANVLGRTFAGKRADGVGWTMEFGADGSFRSSSVSENGGVPRTETGRVRMEGDKLCQDMRKAIESGCNMVRLKDNTLFYKRNSNGEVLTLVAQ